MQSVDKREVVNALIALGISRYRAAPPFLRFAWWLGIDVAPLPLWSSRSIALFHCALLMPSAIVLLTAFSRLPTWVTVSCAISLFLVGVPIGVLFHNRFKRRHGVTTESSLLAETFR